MNNVPFKEYFGILLVSFVISFFTINSFNKKEQHVQKQEVIKKNYKQTKHKEKNTKTITPDKDVQVETNSITITIPSPTAEPKTLN